jgi:hypothetical protein
MKNKCAAFIIMHHLIKKIEKKLKERHYWIKHLYQTKNQDGGGRLLQTLN